MACPIIVPRYAQSARALSGGNASELGDAQGQADSKRVMAVTRPGLRPPRRALSVGNPVNHPGERHIAFNAASRDQWSGFEDHRRKVSDLLSAGGDPGRTRLCVLGAGNCNDLDLPALLQSHRAVHLVDLDSDALGRGAVRQGVGEHPSLRLFGKVDLTGLLDTIAGFTPATPIPPESLAALAERPARTVPPVLAGPYDVVASTCLLSPLIGNAFHSIGESHPQFMAMVQAIRIGHLRLLAELSAPGGTMILITDISSSDLLPELRVASGSRRSPAFSPDGPRSELLPRPESRGPRVDRRARPRSEPRVAGRESIAPWRWSLHERVYLVWALRFAASRPYRVDKPPAGPDNRGAGAIRLMPTR